MSMTWNFLAAAFVVITAVVLLAGLGWRRIAAGGLVALFAGVGGGMMFGLLAYRIALRVDRVAAAAGGGGALAVGFVVGALAAVIVLVWTLVWLVQTNRVAIERAATSRMWLVLGCVGLLLASTWGAKRLAKKHPSLATTEQLALAFAETPRADLEEELVRRRQESVPGILEVLENRDAMETEDNERIEPQQLAQLVRVLGRVGGPEALAALRKMVVDDELTEIRVAAALALAENQDATGLPLIVEVLKERRDADWRQQQPAMLHALGNLKATNHVGVIRAALTPATNAVPGTVPSFLRIRAGVSALAAINTDEAWVLIGELAVDSNKARRVMVMHALELSPGPRQVPLLLAALGDAEKEVREAAYVALVRSEPRLKGKLEPKWSDANVEKVRDLLKPAPPAAPAP